MALSFVVLGCCLSVALGQFLNLYGRPRDPCDVVFSDMRNGGFLVRDCAYIDPHVYWRIEHQMTWEGARSACQQVSGGELTSIHSFDEKTTVYAMAQNNLMGRYTEVDKVQNQGVWIGLRTDQTGVWRWSDTSVLAYEDWLTGYNNNTQGAQVDRRCTQVLSVAAFPTGFVSTGWNAISCGASMKSICKAPRIAVLPG